MTMENLRLWLEAFEFTVVFCSAVSNGVIKSLRAPAVVEYYFLFCSVFSFNLPKVLEKNLFIIKLS